MRLSEIVGRDQPERLGALADVVSCLALYADPVYSPSQAELVETLRDHLDWLYRLLAASAGVIRGKVVLTELEANLYNAIAATVPGLTARVMPVATRDQADKPVPGPTPNPPSEVFG